MAIWPFSRKKRKTNKSKEINIAPSPPPLPSTPPPPSTPPTAPSSASPPPIFHIADLQKSPSSSRRKVYPSRQEGSPWSLKRRKNHNPVSPEQLGALYRDGARSPTPDRSGSRVDDVDRSQQSNRRVNHRHSQNDLPTRSSTSSSVNHPHKRNVLRKQVRVQSEGSQTTGPHLTLSRASTSSGYAHRYQITKVDQRLRSLESPMERPMSELSMAPVDELISSSLPSRTSLRALKVRSLDVLAPRPKLRMKDKDFPQWSSLNRAGDENQGSLERSGSVRSTTRSPQPTTSKWRTELQALNSIPTYELKKSKVYGLADEMDSRGLREAMERDKKRRDKKIEEQAAHAQAKLERRAAKQRAEELAAKAFADAQLASSSPSTPTRRAGAPDDLPTPAGSPSGRKDGANTPMSWLHDPSRENIAREVKQSMLNSGSPDIKPHLSIPSSRDQSGLPSPDTDDEIFIQTATAVRLSNCSSASPPPSPTIARSPTSPILVHHSSSRKNSRDLDTELARRERKSIQRDSKARDDGALETAWTSFFKKAAAARGQGNHETSHFRSSSEDVSSSKLQSAREKSFLEPPTPGSRGDSTSLASPHHFTPEQSDTSFRDNDADDSSERVVTPIQTDLDRITFGTVVAHRLTPQSGHRHSADARIPIPGASNRGGSPFMRHDSPGRHLKRQSEDIYETSSSRSSLVNQRGFDDGVPKSLASVDSEGSWFRQKLGSPHAFAPVSPLRNSAASLRHRYKEVEEHEDKRASIQADDFFTGVPPDTVDISSEEDDEHAILADFVDDDDDDSISAPGTSGGEGQAGGLSVPSGKWRESLARKPTIMRVESGRVGAQEKIVKVYDTTSRTYSGSSGDGDEDVTGQESMFHAAVTPMKGELVIDPEEEARRRERNSASPTLGRESPTIVHHPDTS